MRFGWMAAAAVAMVAATPASAARYFEFQVIGQTPVPFYNPTTGAELYKLVTQSTVTSRFDTSNLLPSSNSSGTRVVLNFLSTSANISTVGGPGGTTFSVSFDPASISVGETLMRVPAAGGAFGFTSCDRSACVNTAGTFLTLFARTSDVAPPTLAAEETTAIVGFIGVPEPSTWALMVLGVGAVGGIARRRRTAMQAA